MRSSLRLLLRRRSYRALWLADLASLIGDWFSVVAVSVVAGAAAGSAAAGALALATVLAAHLLPQALFAPVAGVLADRLDRRALLLGGSIVEGLVTIGMAVAASRGASGTMQALLFARGLVAALREPAAGAALPRLVAADELALANGLGAATWSVTFVVGMALGGVAAEVGPVFALAVDAASFFVAASLLATLPPLAPPVEVASAGVGERLAALGADFRAAVRRSWHAPLRRPVFMKTPVALASGAAWVALNQSAAVRPFAGGTAATLGLLQAMRGLGTGVGPALFAVLLARGVPARKVVTASAVAVALGALAMPSATGPVGALLASLVWGAGGGALWVHSVTDIQRLAGERFRGRMLALDALGFSAAMAAGAFLFALGVERGVDPLAVSALAVGLSAAGWLAVVGSDAKNSAVSAARVQHQGTP